jgi:DNA invertase Pin-like site-specific DNA recombinase
LDEQGPNIDAHIDRRQSVYTAPVPVNTVYTLLSIQEQTRVAMANGTTSKFVVLLRVSTTKQGGDGNGIAAQRRDINLFLQQQEHPLVLAEFVEVVSGANPQRPMLEQALEMCLKHKASLLVQKVDRLTRDVETLGKLTKMRGIHIRIASLPNADNFQIHLFGILGAQEREFISQRTRAAMGEAKKRGVKFGNPRLSELNQTRKREARIFAHEHAQLILNLRSEKRTYREICELLNASGIKTRNGGKFNPVQIHRIIKRVSGVGK